jgi:hypothetical protein
LIFIVYTVRLADPLSGAGKAAENARFPNV